MNDQNPKTNAEGYPDPTAHQAIQNTATDEERFHALLHTIFYLCDIAGFTMSGRIVLIDRKTGKVWR